VREQGKGDNYSPLPLTLPLQGARQSSPFSPNSWDTPRQICGKMVPGDHYAAWMSTYEAVRGHRLVPLRDVWRLRHRLSARVTPSGNFLEVTVILKPIFLIR